MKINGQLQTGFTLLELLVVISIIGVLASVILPSLGSARASARDARRVSDLEQITKAISLYYLKYDKLPLHDQRVARGRNQLRADSFDGNGTPATWDQVENELREFIKKLPEDPVNNGNPYVLDGYSYSYNVFQTTAVGDGNKSEKYNLIAKFETNHTLRCEKIGYWFNLPIGVAGEGYICPGDQGKSPLSPAWAGVSPSIKNYLYVKGGKGNFDFK